MKSTLEHIMAAKKPPSIPLPKSWTKHVRTAMLHVISRAQYATAYTRSWAADSTNARVRISHAIRVANQVAPGAQWPEWPGQSPSTRLACQPVLYQGS